MNRLSLGVLFVVGMFSLSCGGDVKTPERRDFNNASPRPPLAPQSPEDGGPLAEPLPFDGKICGYWESHATPAGDYQFVEQMVAAKQDGKTIVKGRFDLRANPVLHYGFSSAVLERDAWAPDIRGFQKIIFEKLKDIPWYARAFVRLSGDWKKVFGKTSYSDAKEKTEKSVNELERLEIYYQADPNGTNPPGRSNLNWLMGVREKAVGGVIKDEVAAFAYGQMVNLYDNSLFQMFLEQMGITEIAKNDLQMVQRRLMQRTRLFSHDDWAGRASDVRDAVRLLESTAATDDFDTKLCRFSVSQRLMAQVLVLAGTQRLPLDGSGYPVLKFTAVDQNEFDLATEALETKTACGAAQAREDVQLNTARPFVDKRIGDWVRLTVQPMGGVFSEVDSLGAIVKPVVVDQDWILNSLSSGADIRPIGGKNISGFLRSMSLWVNLAQFRSDKVWTETRTETVRYEGRDYQCAREGVASGSGNDGIRITNKLLQLGIGLTGVALNTFANHVIEPDSDNRRLYIQGGPDANNSYNLNDVGVVAIGVLDAMRGLKNPSAYEVELLGADRVQTLAGVADSMNGLLTLFVFEGVGRVRRGEVHPEHPLIRTLRYLGLRWGNRSLAELEVGKGF